jgi:hypothetical protein
MTSKLSGAKVRSNLALDQKRPTIVVEDPRVRNSGYLVFPVRFFTGALLLKDLKPPLWRLASRGPTNKAA